MVIQCSNGTLQTTSKFLSCTYIKSSCQNDISLRIGAVEINAATAYVKRKQIMEPKLEGRILMKN